MTTYSVLLILLFNLNLNLRAQECTNGKPLVQPGCVIECVEGTYIQNCELQSCGAKPVVDIGCKVTECVGGSWKVVCECGPKTVPEPGCVVKECREGKWIQDCAGKRCPSLRPISPPGCTQECVKGVWVRKCE